MRGLEDLDPSTLYKMEMPPPLAGGENEKKFAYVAMIVIKITSSNRLSRKLAKNGWKRTPHPKQLISHTNPFGPSPQTFLVESCYKLFC